MTVIGVTARLTLRRFTPDDVSNLFDLNSDPEVMRFLTGGRATPRAEIRDQIIPFHLAFYERSSGEFRGWFHLRPGPGQDPANVELGYRLRRAAWNKGYATEGSRALIRTGFTELAVGRVFAHTMTVNSGSRHVLEKCGLSLVRTSPYEGNDAIEGSERGEVEYALTRAEWDLTAVTARR